MRLIRLSEDYITEIISGKIGARRSQLTDSVVTLGSFDGLHLGHQKLIERVNFAHRDNGLSAGAVFTFMQHPRQILSPGGDPYLLTTWREKLALLEELDCDAIVAADFCPGLSRLDFRTFVSRFLVDYLGLKHLVAGYDVHLGADRGGTAETLMDLGAALKRTHANPSRASSRNAASPRTFERVFHPGAHLYSTDGDALTDVGARALLHLLSQAPLGAVLELPVVLVHRFLEGPDVAVEQGVIHELLDHVQHEEFGAGPPGDRGRVGGPAMKAEGFAKINLALAEPPRFTAEPIDGVGRHHHGTQLPNKGGNGALG